ncbi:MAG TPA: metal-dependent transcriptional regulator [Phycisphaerae bacterium]|nr:metal-dependent transcriptional regulator [Phycisphaerae bacterium]
MTQATPATGLSESLQDYLEAIYLLAQRHGVARMKEIAARVGVGKSSVTCGVQALAERGLVNYEPYQYVTLTETGEVMGKALLRKHRVLKRFLMEVLGVPEEEAEAVGCKMEHAIKGDVLDRFVRFLDFVHQQSGSDGSPAEAFAAFCEGRTDEAEGESPAAAES